MGVADAGGEAANPFRDVTPTTSHYEDILWLAQTGVSRGWDMGGVYEFRGMNSVVRQDMAALLHRLDTYVKEHRLACRPQGSKPIFPCWRATVRPVCGLRRMTMDTKNGAPYQGAPHSRFDWDLRSLRHWSHPLAGDVVAPAIRARVPPQSLSTSASSDNNHSFRCRHGVVRRLAQAHPDAPHVPHADGRQVLVMVPSALSLGHPQEVEA